MASRKASLAFIFTTILVDMIGIGIIIPVMPALIENLTGETTSDAAWYGTLLMVSFAGLQFLFSPVLGELSDRFGRRPILLLSLLGLSIDYLFHAYAPTLGWLFIGRILAGITGASHTVASAYTADISTKENKAKNFGMIGAAFGLGFVVGPIIGGIFGDIDIKLPFFIASGLAFVNFLFGLIFVPESLPKENRRSINARKMIPFVSLAQLSTYKGIGGMIIALFLANVAGQALPATWSYFTIEMFDWSEAQVGYSLSFVGLMVAIVQGALVGPVVKRFGQKKTISIGFLLWSVGMLSFAFAFKPWMLYAFTILYVLGGVCGPTLQSLLSNQVSETEQGNLQGALTSMMSITTIVGPFLAGGVFYLFTGNHSPFYFPGAPYVTSALILAASSIVAIASLKRIKDLD